MFGLYHDEGLNPSTDNGIQKSDAGGPGAEAKQLIIALRCGRLANRLVLSANFIALAEEQGHRLANLAFHSYAHLFEGTRGDVYCRYPAPARRSWLDGLPGAAGLIRKTRLFYQAVRLASRFNARFHPLGRRVVTLQEIRGAEVSRLDGPELQARIAPAKLVFVYGWRFRAPDWVRKHAGKIRDHFRPVAAVEQTSNQLMSDLRRQAGVAVGVHVRHGDYRGWKQGRHFYPVSRYAAWMRELAGQLPGRETAFFVCSDEPRSRDEFAGLRVVMGGGSPLEDLVTLSKCDYILGPPSTFSQWASFYGGRPLYQPTSVEDRVILEEFEVSSLAGIP